MSEQDLLKTPLYDSHVKLGGRLVPFAGYSLPVRYSELRLEHEAVRSTAGLFDVSHMGEIFFEGVGALQALQYLTCNDVSKLVDGKAQYNAFLNEEGGVVDDIIVYRLKSDRFLVCVNAANAAKDWRWVQKNVANFDVSLSDKSAQYGQVALQGPASVEILAKLDGIPAAAEGLKYFSVLETDSPYGDIIVARTGYTGEDGFEIFVPWDTTVSLWDDLIAAGASAGLLPCGLGARDTLRLEACYPLHGHELREDLPALESGLNWIIKPDKGEFIGREAIVQLAKSGPQKRLVGFIVDGKGIVRDEAAIIDEDGEKIGIVTSGTQTPTLGKALGLALVPVGKTKIGTTLAASVRGRTIPIVVTKTPFYSRK